jgi:phosphorylcholine metabolism protein LicD
MKEFIDEQLNWITDILDENENYLLREGKPIILEKKDIFPLKRLKFEDRTFPVLNNYKKFLKIKYGDYLKLPPIEERKPVHGLD